MISVELSPSSSISTAPQFAPPITIWTIDGDDAPDVAPVLQAAGPLGAFLAWERCRRIAAELGARLHYLVALALDEPVGVFPVAELATNGMTRLVSFPESPIGGPIAGDARIAELLRGRARRLAAARSVAPIQVARLHEVSLLRSPPESPPWIVTRPDIPLSQATPRFATFAVVRHIGKTALVEAIDPRRPLTIADVAAVLARLRASGVGNEVEQIVFRGAALASCARRALLTSDEARVCIHELTE
ncbi:MAG: hypothetical protein SF069_16060 [Phycisphaerae bacterium]|nr:hypothetical protein [Phycisphaerae bacterium]